MLSLHTVGACHAVQQMELSELSHTWWRYLSAFLVCWHSLCSCENAKDTSYLRKSNNFCGNPSRLSIKICAEIRGSSVVSPRNCLPGTHGFVLWESSEQSLWDRRFESSKLSLGVLRTILGSLRNHPLQTSLLSWLTATHSPQGLCKSCINRCAISFERSTATLQRNILQVRTEVPRIPSNVTTYNL